MGNQKASKVIILLALAVLLTACNNLSLKWPEYNGFVADVVPSIQEQNELIMNRLNAHGFETLENDRGVIVYLPPSIYFPTSQSDISLEARQKISIIADEVNHKYLQGRAIEVLGHSSTIGSDKVNMALSKARAESATAELVFSKVAKERISTFWFGESRPRYSEQDAQGNVKEGAATKNQRVEFVILNPA